MTAREKAVEPRAFQAAFYLNAEPAAFLDPHDVVAAANPAFAKLYGDEAAERRAFVENFAPEDRPRVEWLLRDARRWSEASVDNCRLRGPPGRPVDLWAHQFVASNGDRLLLVRSRSSAPRLEAERLHEAAVSAARACNEATGWQRLAEGIEGVARRTLPHADGVAWLHLDGGRWLVAHASGAFAPRWSPPAVLPGDSAWTAFARQAESVLIADVALELTGERTHLLLASSHAALLVSPILTRGQADHLLLASAPGQASFSLEDLRCLDAVAREMAAAIVRLDDREALERSHARLVEALDAREALLGRVRRLNEELEEFSLWTTHDLREPLRGLATLSSLLASEAAGVGAGDVEALARQVEASATRLKEHIRDLHEFQEAAHDRGHREDARVEDLVEGAASDERVEVAMHPPARDLRVVVDPGRVRRALADVLRFVSSRGSRPVDVEAGGERELVRLSFDLPPDWSSQKSELAFRVVSKTDSLALARRIALQHGGSLRFEPADGRPRLVLLLPQAPPEGG